MIETETDERKISEDLDFLDMSKYKVVYIIYVGKDVDNKNIYQFILSNNPDDVFIHPNHPDTKLFRYTYATFYDRIQDSDNELGELMEMLKADGELDNTFVFYFGDNGGSLPFSKGYTTETGLHVPMIVYVPKKWRNRSKLHQRPRMMDPLLTAKT